MKFIFTLFLLTLIFKTSFAMSFCQIDGSVIRGAYFDEKNISSIKACDSAKHIDNLLHKVKEIYSFAPRISVHLIEEFDNASYDNGSLIKIPLRFYSVNKNKEKIYKNQKDLDAIIFHEYGHAVLAQHLAKKWDTFTYYNHLGHQISSLKQKLFLDENNEKLKKSLKEAEEEFIYRRSMRTFTRTIIPYQELYADILSTFMLNDKKAIMNSIKTDHDSEKLELLYRARDFTRSSLDLEELAFEPHAYFYKVRQHIGDNLWPEDETSRNIVLHKILYLLAEEIEYSHYFSLFMTDPIFDNEELITRIQEIDP